MPDIRYALKNGDPTSTGGQLIAHRRDFTHHGVPMGVEGDIATCPACNSSGPVFNDCHPHFDVMGKQLLVSGARVYCKCPIKPYVIHTQWDTTVEVNRTGCDTNPASGVKAASGYTAASLNTADDDLEHYFEIVDAETGRPIEGMTYKISSYGQTLVHDETLSGGISQSFAVKDHPHMVLVIWRAGDVR